VSAESVSILLDAGLIACRDPWSYLQDLDVAEVIGDWTFGEAENPFRGSQILPPKDWPHS
jgi:hypothetical protein